jgi:hypothetical protein
LRSTSSQLQMRGSRWGGRGAGNRPVRAPRVQQWHFLVLGRKHHCSTLNALPRQSPIQKKVFRTGMLQMLLSVWTDECVCVCDVQVVISGSAVGEMALHFLEK